MLGLPFFGKDTEYGKKENCDVDEQRVDVERKVYAGAPLDLSTIPACMCTCSDNKSKNNYISTVQVSSDYENNK